MSLYFERDRFGGERYPWGSGYAQTGEWWWLKKTSVPAAWDPMGVTGIVAYGGELHVDNGYGVAGWVPVSDTIRFEAEELAHLLKEAREILMEHNGSRVSQATEEDVIAELVLLDANDFVDEMISTGKIEDYLPGYLGPDDEWNGAQPYRNPQPQWNIERHRWE